MTKQDINTAIITINEFVQGSPLPYTVLDATHINAAYPEQKLEIAMAILSRDYQTPRLLAAPMKCLMMSMVNR